MVYQGRACHLSVPVVYLHYSLGLSVVIEPKKESV